MIQLRNNGRQFPSSLPRFIVPFPSPHFRKPISITYLSRRERPSAPISLFLRKPLHASIHSMNSQLPSTAVTSENPDESFSHPPNASYASDELAREFLNPLTHSLAHSRSSATEKGRKRHRRLCNPPTATP